MKISKQKLRQIIKEEIEAHQLQKKSMRDHAMEKIDELQDEQLLRLWHGNNYSKSAR